MIEASKIRKKYPRLPAGLWFIAEAAGEEAMIKMARNFGGTTIKVGSFIKKDGSISSRRTPQNMVGLIGEEAFRKIVGRMNKDFVLKLYVPKYSIRKHYDNVDNVRQLRANGVKVSKIASILEVSERTIYQIMRNCKDDYQQ